MSKTLKIYLFVFALLIAVMVAIDYAREKPEDWSPTYRPEEKKPLDLYVLNREIDCLFNDSVIRCDKNPYEYFQHRDSINIKKETYLFVSAYVFFDEALLGKMLNAVEQGNTLFVVSDGFPPDLMDTLRIDCEYISCDNEIVFNSQVADRPELKLRFSNQAWSDREYALSPVFGQYAFVSADTTISTALGYMTFADGSQYINFMKLRFGRGAIILHNQPAVFSNYSLLSGEPLQDYVRKVLGYLPDRPLVWFVEAKQGGRMEKNQLSVIFKYPALRMTWLIFLYGLIVFVFFTAKRKQRVVPVIKPLQNTTVEFVRVIGNLYFQEGDVLGIARKKIMYFFDRVRRSYNIDTRLPEEELMNRLHFKSGKNKELIREILALIREINRQNRCSEQTLIELSMLIDGFWDNCGIKGRESG